MHNLAHALRLDRATRAAITGAGGKTETLFQLANDFEPPVLLASSAHMGAWQLGRAEAHYSITTAGELDFLESGVPEQICLFTGPLDVEKQRTRGLDAASLERLYELARGKGIPLLIEADGSRQRPLKAPAEHEPPIPPFVDTVLVVAGLKGLGKPLDEEHVYGVDRFSSLSGLAKGVAIPVEAVESVLLHPNGGRKNIPASARSIAILNQADTPQLRQAAGAAARRLLEKYDAVAVTSFQPDPKGFEKPLGSGWNAIDAVYEPVAAVVLAAGESRRMGAPKLLLEWRGEPVIRHTVRAALTAGTQAVIVVTGANAEAVMSALEGLPVTCVHNPDWQDGQGGSVAVGIKSVPERTGAAVFLLGDQPQIPTELIAKVIERHAHSHSLAIAPFVAGRRGNPVLFDRMLFAELAGLRGNAGGRQVLAHVDVESVEWPDETILLDLDTPEDYARLKNAEENRNG